MSKSSSIAKMNAVIQEISDEVMEREELILCIAIALLSKRNLFILGDTGQAKSYVINAFRKRITGARQFEKLMSKQTDEEQLFGRLDLASIIPGNVSAEVLRKDPEYVKLHDSLSLLLDSFQQNPSDPSIQQQMVDQMKRMEFQRRTLSAVYGSNPAMITKGKIPDSEIVFLDEIFKSNESVLNSLLTALNERIWTNEGEVISLPVISFLSASNEIPNWDNPEERILKPLYDRFDLKIKTEYVEDRNNRLAMLRRKRGSQVPVLATLTLSELTELQNDVYTVAVTGEIDETMDDILCELRRKGVHVSDRKFFGYQPIVEAYALLQGRSAVVRHDLMILKSYFWNTPEEIAVVEDVLRRFCENPCAEKLKVITDDAAESFIQFEAADNKKKALIKLRNEFVRLYDGLCVLKSDAAQNDLSLIDGAMTKIEEMSRDASSAAGNTYIPLPKLKELSKQAEQQKQHKKGELLC